MSTEAFVLELKDNRQYQQLLEGSPQTCGMRSGRVYLTEGESCREHSTKAHEELLVFLSGKGRALLGKEKTPKPVAAGNVMYIPPHTIHNIENTSPEPLVYIYCVAPVTQKQEE